MKAALLSFVFFLSCLPISVGALAADKQLGPLSAIVIENGKTLPYVVFLHGYGGSGEDSYKQLKREITTDQSLSQVNWIFPTGPGFAITSVDQVGNPIVKEWQDSLAAARSDLSKMLKAAKVSESRVIWAGFSMGGITAVDYVLHSKNAPLGLIVYSGIYYGSTDWKRSSTLKGLPFSLHHDPTDETLPFEEAKKLEKLLLNLGMKGKLHSHSKGHAVAAGSISKTIATTLAP